MEHPVPGLAGNDQIPEDGLPNIRPGLSRRNERRWSRDAPGGAEKRLGVGSVVATKALVSNGSGGTAGRLAMGIDISAPITSAATSAIPRMQRVRNCGFFERATSQGCGKFGTGVKKSEEDRLYASCANCGKGAKSHSTFPALSVTNGACLPGSTGRRLRNPVLALERAARRCRRAMDPKLAHGAESDKSSQRGASP
jgi:hypothetical protein